MERFIIRRVSDGLYYCAKPGQYVNLEEHRWTPDINKVRLYTREAFARRTIKDLPIKDEVVIASVSLLATN
jgi:hypothetical protein